MTTTFLDIFTNTDPDYARFDAHGDVTYGRYEIARFKLRASLMPKDSHYYLFFTKGFYYSYTIEHLSSSYDIYVNDNGTEMDTNAAMQAGGFVLTHTSPFANIGIFPVPERWVFVYIERQYGNGRPETTKAYRSTLTGEIRLETTLDDEATRY